MKVHKRTRKGLTLIEVILTIAIMTIIGQALYSIYHVGTKSFEINRDMGFTQQDARLILENLNNEMRTAKEVSTDIIDSGNKYSSIVKDGNVLKKISYVMNESGDFVEDSTKILGTNINMLNFKPIDQNPEDINIEYITDMISVEIVTNEENVSRSYTMDIRLENGNIIKYSTNELGEYNLPETIDRIYYTKYDE
ncbi:MAG: prepilin-type N-terminal cleavage/methylation domain-containing protein [Tissierellia bacterium]|nr:prepilin-type N-terminal cleavage/methylation domain-containing protein [Tissierellia bacterium]